MATRTPGDPTPYNAQASTHAPHNQNTSSPQCIVEGLIFGPPQVVVVVPPPPPPPVVVVAPPPVIISNYFIGGLPCPWPAVVPFVDPFVFW